MAIPDNNSLGQIFSTWYATNPTEAMDFALAIEDPTLRHHALTSWSGCASTGELLEVIAKTPVGANRSSLVESLWSKAYGDEKESAAVRDFVQAAAPGDIPVGTVAAISRGYATQNPEAALSWVASLPEAFQSASVGFVLSAWKDKVAASFAVERLPEGPMKAAALHTLMPDPKHPFR